MSAGPPAVVAFDAIGTLFSLESLRPRLRAAGLPGHVLEVWFAQILRDALALDATGVYRPFREVATACLAGLLPDAGPDSQQRVDSVVDGFTELAAHSDAAPAIRSLRGSGIRVVVLTNGSTSASEALLERAGMRDLVERVVSAEEVCRWKPHRDVYLRCAAAVDAEPSGLALIAAHAWDVHGASRAGFATGYVARDEKPFPAVMDAPDVTGATLAEVSGKLAALR